MVWLSTRILRFKLLSHKFVGPFEIIRQVNPVAYRLQLPASYRICPTFHISLLKPAHPLGSGETSGVELPPPLDIEGSPAYQVHALLDSRWVRSQIQYLVDWEGFRGGRCPARRQRRRVPAAPSSHPPAPWGVPDPSETDIVAPEPSFVGGRRSVRVLGGGRRSVLLLGGGRCLALLLDGGRHSALLLGCGRRSAPPLGCGRRVGPFGLAVGSCAPPTCLAPASRSPHVPRLDPRSPHLPRLGPRFPPLALLLLLAPPQCLAAPPTGLSMFLAPPQDPSLDRTFWGGL
ncbi:hypothetical protein QTP86_015858, partial [Hemibagrus guttatus]